MPGFKISSLLRRRWVWATAGILLAIPALLLAMFYWWLLPNLPQYKDDVAGLLSSATGYTITLDKLDGEWGGARPRLTLEGVRVSEGGRPVLYFSKLEGRFGWRTLIALEPRFHELIIDAPALTVRRSEDGMLQIGGLRVDPNSPDTSFTDWMLKQYAVHMQGVTVAWIDDSLGGQPLVLRDVNFRLQNLFNRHSFQLGFAPPAHLAKPLRLNGVLYGHSLSKRKDWRGEISLDIPALELAAWNHWLPEQYRQLRGHGSIDARLELDQGRFSASSLKVNLAGLHLEAPQLASKLELERLVGEIGWKRDRGPDADSVQTVYARGLELKNPSGRQTAPIDFSYRWGADEQKITAAQLPLGEIEGVVNALLEGENRKAEFAALDLKGMIDSLELDWRGELAAPEKIKVDARFTGLGWAAGDKRPGAANLSGMLAGNEEGGVYSITGKRAGVDLPELFEYPEFRFDTLNLRGGWKRLGQSRYSIEIADAAVSSEDVSATLHGRYELGNNGPGVADLTGRVERGKGARVERYLPLVIGKPTRDWLKTAILAGDIKDGSFKLQGDLEKFPFKNTNEGVFRVAGRITNAQLRYADDYPQIDGIDGEVLFEGIRMEIRANKARIFGAQLNKVKAVIPDLETYDELLEVNGEATGPAQEFIRFVNFSPVTDRIDGLTEEMTANGDMRLQLSLKMPLRRNEQTTVAGRLFFDKNEIFPGPDMPRLEQVGGTLDFTGSTIAAQKITARILGGPSVVTVATEGGQVRVRGQGTFTAASLDTWFGKEIAARLSGQSDWKGELRFGHGKKALLHLESNLVGLNSRLPAPMGKQASKPAQFVFEQRGQDDDTKWSSVQYGTIATAVWLSLPSPSGYRVERGELNFGGTAQKPEEPGLQLSGAVSEFNLGEWLDIMPSGQASKAAGVSGIDLTLENLELLGRQFHGIAIKGKLKGNLLRTSVTGQGIAGNLTFRRADETPSRISAQFRQFTLPDRLPYASPSKAIRLQSASFPALDLQVDELKFGSRPMGRLEVIAHGVPNGMAIEQLNLTHSDSAIRMSGTWKDTGLGETRMKVNGDIRDVGQMLNRFGYSDAVRKGAATVTGEVTWLRSPADFTFETLDGTLRLEAKNGQFLKIDAGAGKLLGIASLQSLPRRITLDFRDVFSEGFAFDEIYSTMQVADGAIYTNDFLMKGPAATVKMSGVAKLKDESVKLRVKVVPKISEGVAVAGALLGGPVAGVGALLMQKVLKDPFEEAISFEYLVDGKWDSPAVTKLAKQKSVQE